MLPDIQEALERSVFHALRKKIVSLGYLPDIDNFDVSNSNLSVAKAAQDSYKTAINNIVINKGFCIEIFNYTPPEQRGVLKSPRMVLKTESFLPGELGLDTTGHYEKIGGNTFVKKQNPSIVSDFYFNVHVNAISIEQLRVLNGIIVTTLPRRGYMKWYTEEGMRPSQNLFVNYLSHSDFTWQSESIIEKVYRYGIPDAHEVDAKTILENIAPISTIELEKLNLFIEKDE